MQTLMMTSAHDVYKKQSVMTASPAELIVMLYEGLKKNMLLAKRAIGRNDPSGAHTHLMKSQAIVEELINCLDMRIDMSNDLLSIYDYMLYAMSEINIKKDATLIDPVVNMISDLKDAWEEISARQRGGLSLVNE